MSKFRTDRGQGYAPLACVLAGTAALVVGLWAGIAWIVWVGVFAFLAGICSVTDDG